MHARIVCLLETERVIGDSARNTVRLLQTAFLLEMVGLLQTVFIGDRTCLLETLRFSAIADSTLVESSALIENLYCTLWYKSEHRTAFY